MASVIDRLLLVLCKELVMATQRNAWDDNSLAELHATTTNQNIWYENPLLTIRFVDLEEECFWKPTPIPATWHTDPTVLGLRSTGG